MIRRIKSKGFTLVEMLIVIAILAILYSLAAINVLGLQNEARIARIKGDLKTLKLAIETYLKDRTVCPMEDNYQRALLLSNPRILEGNLTDPFGATVSTLYSYGTSGNRRYFVVFSLGMHHDGSANIGNNGMVSAEGSAIYETNGYAGKL